MNATRQRSNFVICADIFLTNRAELQRGHDLQSGRDFQRHNGKTNRFVWSASILRGGPLLRCICRCNGVFLFVGLGGHCAHHTSAARWTEELSTSVLRSDAPDHQNPLVEPARESIGPVLIAVRFQSWSHRSQTDLQFLVAVIHGDPAVSQVPHCSAPPRPQTHALHGHVPLNHAHDRQVDEQQNGLLVLVDEIQQRQGTNPIRRQPHQQDDALCQLSVGDLCTHHAELDADQHAICADK
mmetsp:Transcript_1957/g.5529  ORF Transcript_1957/g.5529 Transcript_1957/m.5529 type:complete len:240 (-) Transcript_1957:678-1397(-)